MGRPHSQTEHIGFRESYLHVLGTRFEIRSRHASNHFMIARFKIDAELVLAGRLDIDVRDYFKTLLLSCVFESGKARKRLCNYELSASGSRESIAC